MTTIHFLILLAIGWAYTLSIAACALSVAVRAGVMDRPGSQGHKAHHLPTPLVGGLACMPPALLGALSMAYAGGMGAHDRSSLIWMSVAVALSTLVGFLDDRRHIPAPLRLLICGSVFAATLALHGDFVIDAVSFESFHMQLLIERRLAILLSMLCLLAFQNSVNMADGRNGLVMGLSIIWCATLLFQGRHPTNLAVAMLLSGLLVTMIFNVRGKLFLGDAGTYGIGALLGLVTIWVHRSGIGLTSSQVISMFLIPIIDMVRLFMLRLMHGRSPFTADHQHLHHYIDREFGWNVGLPIYLSLVATPIIISELNDGWGIPGDVAAVALYVGIILYTRRLSPRARLALH
ncbi:MraY family glycosyltransferase [Sphingomonas sp. DT-51]|uniref:MraY family glycosyltransferase n=1 Tax=Sphingomonas sp. DT-51 TaxID=3396165 RepID=UPI003F1D7425